jgi:hypothetical protein
VVVAAVRRQQRFFAERLVAAILGALEQVVVEQRRHICGRCLVGSGKDTKQKTSKK